MIRPRPAVVAMAPYRPPTAGRRGLLRLDFNENTQGPSPRVLEVLRQSTHEDVSIYPEYGPAYERLAAHFGVGADEILLSNGSDGLFESFFKTFVDPGEPVLILDPSYAMFRFYGELFGAKVSLLPYRADLSFPATELLEQLERLRPRLCLLADPNNPTGTRVPSDLFRDAVRRAPDTLFVLDQAYVEFVEQAGSRAPVERAPNVVVTRTFSKAYGLAGLRLGVGLGPTDLVAAIRKGQSPYGVSALTVKCALAALDDPAWVEGYVSQTRAGRAELCAFLRSRAIGFAPSEANFVLARLGSHCDAVMKGLTLQGVLVRDRRPPPSGSSPGAALLDGCVRLGVGTLEETRTLIRALEKLLPSGDSP